MKGKDIPAVKLVLMLAFQMAEKRIKKLEKAKVPTPELLKREVTI